MKDECQDDFVVGSGGVVAVVAAAAAAAVGVGVGNSKKAGGVAVNGGGRDGGCGGHATIPILVVPLQFVYPYQQIITATTKINR